MRSNELVFFTQKTDIQHKMVLGKSCQLYVQYGLNQELFQIIRKIKQERLEFQGIVQNNQNSSNKVVGGAKNLIKKIQRPPMQFCHQSVSVILLSMLTYKPNDHLVCWLLKVKCKAYSIVSWIIWRDLSYSGCCSKLIAFHFTF